MTTDIEAQLAVATAKRRTAADPEGQLAVDVLETDDELLVIATVAGVTDEDLDISVTKDTLTVRGRRTQDAIMLGTKSHHRELFWGTFSRTIILPLDVDPETTKASMRSGVLVVRLPKLERRLTKKIRINH